MAGIIVSLASRVFLYVYEDHPPPTTRHSKAVSPTDPPSAAETAAWQASFRLAEEKAAKYWATMMLKDDYVVSYPTVMGTLCGDQ